MDWRGERGTEGGAVRKGESGGDEGRERERE